MEVGDGSLSRCLGVAGGVTSLSRCWLGAFLAPHSESVYYTETMLQT